jgi:hypothetical protein
MAAQAFHHVLELVVRDLHERVAIAHANPADFGSTQLAHLAHDARDLADPRAVTAADVQEQDPAGGSVLVVPGSVAQPFVVRAVVSWLVIVVVSVGRRTRAACGLRCRCADVARRLGAVSVAIVGLAARSLGASARG